MIPAIFSCSVKIMKTSLSRFGIYTGVLTLSVLLSGCKQVGQQVQNKVEEVAQQAQTALLSEKDLAGISDPLIRRHFVAQANARAYRITSKSSGRGEGTTTTEIQIVGSDMRFHSLTQMGGKSSQEMIVIGDTTYVKDPSGVWWKQVNKPTENKEDTTSPFKVPKADDIKQEFTKKQEKTEFKQLGTEPCGDRTCYKYQEIDAGNKEGARTFWFDNKDFLLRRDEQKFGEFTTTNEYSYDNISINAPTPTKDVPQGRSVFEYMTGAPVVPDVKKGSIPTKEELDKLLKQTQQSGDTQGGDTQSLDSGTPGN